MDTFTPERRSEIMRRIRAANTEPELAVRRYLHAHGFRFRLHQATLPGKPDVVLRKYRAAIYVNGCFWHGHHCKDGRRPKSNSEYWERKLDRNLQRDKLTGKRMKALGWRRIVVWGCETKNAKALEKLTAEIIS
jgi:DNA mismatch endonuclease (patch repair protein)